LLLYDQDSDQDRIKNIAQHQSSRLIQDNPRFSKRATPSPRINSVLLLGTCTVYRREFFVKLCAENGIEVLHPNSFNYLFALERQDFIQNFVTYCHSNNKFAIAVNVHQYPDSVLETAKIFLLLANKCDIVLSEHSKCTTQEKTIASAVNNRLEYCDTLLSMIRRIQNLFQQKYNGQLQEDLRDPDFLKQKMEKVEQKIFEKSVQF